MIKILVVEDSRVARDLMVYLLDAAPNLSVVGTAEDGQAALDFLANPSNPRPDLITMDISMPRLDGFETTRRIMENDPIPIVMVSANLTPGEVDLAFQALDAGALAAIEKPRGPNHPDSARLAAQLVQTVRAMAEVRVVKRWKKMASAPKIAPQPIPKNPKTIEIVAIGASTGGPPVLHEILADLPTDFSIPIVIVQHIAAGFSAGMAHWLNQTTKFPVLTATGGDVLRPGYAYLAPDHFHLGIDREKRIVLSPQPPENGLRPAVSFLFRSVAQSFGAGVIGVLLTGMGKDGAEELAQLRTLGAVTIAQDKETSVVHGMPGEAIRLNGATHILPPKRIAAVLAGLVSKK